MFRIFIFQEPAKFLYVWRILSLEPQKINYLPIDPQTGFEYVSSAFNDLTNMEIILSLSVSADFSFQKKTYSHFTRSQQQPAPLSLWAPGILRLRTESLNIGAPSKHLGLVLEYFTQELRIFYQAITIVRSGRDFSSCKSGVGSENKPEPLCCTNNIHLLLLDF